MSKSLPEHSAIPVDLTWDLRSMYANDAAWESDFAGLDGADGELQALQGHLGESAANLAASFRLRDDLGRRLEKLYCYSHLRADEDTAQPTYMAMQDRIRSRYTAFMSAAAWVEPEILAIAPDRLASLAADPAMTPFARPLEVIARYRPHTLSAGEERLLSMAAEPLGVASKAFGMLTNADLRFPEVRNEAGELVELTKGNYIRFMESSVRDVRRGAFETLYDTFGKIQNTLAATLDGNVRKQVFNARARRHPSALQASLFHDNVDQSVYDGLIAAIHARLPAYHRYLDLRRKALGLDVLDMYDVYVPIVPDFSMNVPWDEACDWVRQAVKPLGQTYCDAMEHAFTDRWIDVLECRGKRSGAYSSGCYDSNPYVLMNYQENLNGVFTLAHELGHSMHSYFSKKTQPHCTADYTIFVAEVASTTNEALLFHYLANRTTDPKLRAYLYNHLCDEFKGTVYRQTMFAEFEKLIHAKVEAGDALTPESLNTAYYELNKTFHGDAVTPDKRVQLEWARIPHFYYNFYVYKYATGFAAAQIFSQRILAGEPGAVESYLGFLKAGGSKDPLDILADAGVDLRDPAVVQGALNNFDAAVTQLDKLLNG